ncbi:hypothetical protein HW555_003321 [Spodoptera exigua]|uniref:Vestigial n=1 Tax=Spodoptera exigua TaxID=7107 RepID=A0A835GN12_SPOEX|nr:hypothetical protein HW555_003321 [Spodoptera exigua]
MAVSCPEVMYGAYYPYLYGRGAARSFHHAPHFQYDRFNVQSGAGNAGSEAYSGGAAALSSGSASSGAQSPGSPPHAHLAHHAARLRTKEEDLSAHGRASADGTVHSYTQILDAAMIPLRQHVRCAVCAGGGSSDANCVVFTHYSGDVAAVVDEHFARALSLDKPKESVPMVSRNLPASFFNAAAAAGVAGVPAGGACAGVDIYDYDPWHQHYTGTTRPRRTTTWRRRPATAACCWAAAACTRSTSRWTGPPPRSTTPRTTSTPPPARPTPTPPCPVPHAFTLSLMRSDSFHVAAEH